MNLTVSEYKKLMQRIAELEAEVAQPIREQCSYCLAYMDETGETSDEHMRHCEKHPLKLTADELQRLRQVAKVALPLLGFYRKLLDLNDLEFIPEIEHAIDQLTAVILKTGENDECRLRN